MGHPETSTSIIINQKLNMRTTCIALFVLLLSTIEIHGGAVSREKRAPQYAGVYANSKGYAPTQSQCVDKIKNQDLRFVRKPTCSREGLCIEVAENVDSSHVRVYCYDNNAGDVDAEWAVNGDWAGSPNVYQGKNTDCMFMDWGAVEGEYGNRKIQVFCYANQKRVKGTVIDNGSMAIN